MACNSHFVDERVSNRVMHEVQTPIGEFFVTYLGGEATVTFHPRDGRSGYVRTYDHDGAKMTVRALQKRMPAVGDEVTRDGRTFEVTGVKQVDGCCFVERDGIVWEAWK